MSIVDQIISARRQYLRTFGRDPVSIDISEDIDQALCDEMEKLNQWTPFIKGAKLKSMHGGKIHGITIRVLPSIPFTLNWNSTDA